MATTIIRPTGDNNIGSWKNSDAGTTNLYSYIDEDTAVDTDYISLTNSGGSSLILFNFGDVSLSGEPINKLTIYARIQFVASFVYTIALVTHSIEYRRKISATSGFETKSFEWALNPYTGLPWTETEINDVVIGIYAQNHDTKSATAKVSQIYAEILYGSTNLVPIISSPGTMTNDTTIGTVAWNNPDNAKVDDGSTTYALNLSDTTLSNYLKATNFGFSIPNGSTINGIVVSIKKITYTGYLIDSNVKIVKSDGSIGSTNKAIGGDWNIFDIDYVNYGSPTDLWGESWTPEDINDSDFGVVMSVTGNSSGATSAYIDAIRISVYYSETTAGPANLKSYNTNLKANIKTINTNPIANVKSLNTNV